MSRTRAIGVLFCLLSCVSLTAAIVNAVSPSPTERAGLTTREMGQIIAKAPCTCYVSENGEDYDECIAVGDLECSDTLGACASSGYRYWNVWRRICITTGVKNNKKCTDGEHTCYTPTNISPDGTIPDYECYAVPPNPPYDPATYEWYFYYCKDATGKTCQKCKWGTVAGDSTKTDNDHCDPL